MSGMLVAASIWVGLCCPMITGHTTVPPAGDNVLQELRGMMKQLLTQSSSYPVEGKGSCMDTTLNNIETKLETRLNNMETKLETKLNNMETKLETRLNNMETKLETKLESTGTALESAKTALEITKTELESTKASLDVTKTELMSEIKATKTRLEATESALLTTHAVVMKDEMKSVPGDWLEWSAWSECTVTCGGGMQVRSRKCNMTTHGDLTAPCRGLDHELADCHTFCCPRYARTCSELQARGLAVSMEAEIDPDGENGDEDPVVVKCDLDSRPGHAITVIGHDSERRTRVKGFEDEREYEKLLNYNISFVQVLALIDLSASCEQYIRWECFHAGIHVGNKVYTGWLNRTKDFADYFGGAEPGSNSCACGMNQTCQLKNKVCNCDANDNTWRSDDGYLTFKDDLPVTGFVAGDTGHSQEIGYHTVGPLRCWGAAK